MKRKRGKREGKQTCNAIARHCAAVMQFQVQDQALGLFSWVITNDIRFLLDAALTGENKIQSSCICHHRIVSATQRQETAMKDASC